MNLPKIGSHEAANLEMMFQGFDDRQLIRELVRRGRLHVESFNEAYYTELAGEDRYMTGIDQDIGRSIARRIIDQGHVKFDDAASGATTLRRGSLVVLREAKK